MTQHTFAFFAPEYIISPAQLHVRFAITKKGPLGLTDLFHRLIHVVRVSLGQKIMLFDAQYHWEVVVEQIEAKKIVVELIAIHTNIILQPRITLFLPLLKKDDLSQAIADAVQVGVTDIQLVVTERTQRKWQGISELERLVRIGVATAEQCKQFAVPTIAEPLSLQAALGVYKNSTKIICRVDGVSTLDLLSDMQNSTHIVLIIGPEGDFTSQEYSMLEQEGKSMRLTPTVLKSATVAGLSVGVIRSLI